jgi:predicted dehydrogenase
MNSNNKNMRVLVLGCGNMGASHAKAYQLIDGFEICGLVSTGTSKDLLNQELGGQYPVFADYEEALESTKPDAVCISTYPDTHAAFAILAMEHGCHVFLEKPIAHTLEAAMQVARAAVKFNKKLLIGYILRYHPSWQKFIELSQELGKPLVMRMNLNQQSQGTQWKVHRNLMESLSPIVDCGVHYLDVMCQMTKSKPVQVSAIGARLSNEVPEGNYNYGQLQIKFEDQSVGWYEAGWGPMMSETAFFIKDVIGPKGSVSILARDAAAVGNSASIASHTKTESIRVHDAALNDQGKFSSSDRWVDLAGEPDHQELCNREQRYFLWAILEDIDLSQATQDAISSLRIALACDESVKTGNVVRLD